MLSAGKGTAYISEPLNLYHRPGVFDAPVNYWYTYICEDNQDEYLHSFQEMLQLKYHTRAEIRSLRSVKDIGRFLRDCSSFFLGRLREQRVLVKDPFAVFSAPWFEAELGCQIVIIVRHPAAVASSLRRLKWSFDFDQLLSQNLLMREHLAPFREEMLAATNERSDILDRACLLWRVVYSVVAHFQSQFDTFNIVRHEDLSREPMESFRSLYSQLKLGFSPQAVKTITSSSKTGNPRERPDNSIYTTQLDSQANIQNWKTRLSAGEIERIHSQTRDTACLFYADDTWG